MSPCDRDYLWSVPCPARLIGAVLPAIADWCRGRRVGRPMLVGGPSLSTAPRGLGLVHGLEAAGLAVWTFDRATSPSLAVVADAVAGYHFEGCDAVVAVGGGVATEVAKAAALMAGQRHPYRELAPGAGGAAEPVDVSTMPPLLAVPVTAAAAASACGALWIADETGIARPIRHPALRPGEAILADDLIAAVPRGSALRSAAVLALLAADAGAGAGEIAELLAVRQPAELMRPALRLAAILEGAAGPRRRLALTAAVAAGGDFAGVMLALAAPAPWLDEVRRRLAPCPSGVPDASLLWAARAACPPAEADAIDAVLGAIGVAPPQAPRRRGRRMRAP